MRLSNAFPGMAALAGAAQAAQDLLFYQGMTFTEYKQALALNYTVHIASPTEWYAMTTADFAQYKAIVVPDPDCGSLDQIQFLNDTRAAWSPAVAGNVIVMATDTTYHASTQSGAVALMKDGIRFAASGTAGTGLYLSLSCYYDDQSFATVDALAHFGMFVAQGRLSCYDSAHIVATVQPSRTTDPHSQFRLITDSNLSNWSCSAHALISQYPSEGPNGFVPLAVLEDAASAPHAVGIHAFAGGVKGVPYIVARGVTPVGCGDGVVAPQDGEQCDDGAKQNGAPDGLCSTTCQCVYGLDKTGKTCAAPPKSSVYSSAPSSTASASSLALSTKSSTESSIGLSMGLSIGFSVSTPTYSRPTATVTTTTTTTATATSVEVSIETTTKTVLQSTPSSLSSSLSSTLLSSSSYPFNSSSSVVSSSSRSNASSSMPLSGVSSSRTLSSSIISSANASLSAPTSSIPLSTAPQSSGSLTLPYSSASYINSTSSAAVSVSQSLSHISPTSLPRSTYSVSANSSHTSPVSSSNSTILSTEPTSLVPLSGSIGKDSSSYQSLTYSFNATSSLPPISLSSSFVSQSSASSSASPYSTYPYNASSSVSGIFSSASSALPFNSSSASISSLSSVSSSSTYLSLTYNASHSAISTPSGTPPRSSYSHSTLWSNSSTSLPVQSSSLASKMSAPVSSASSSSVPHLSSPYSSLLYNTSTQSASPESSSVSSYSANISDSSSAIPSSSGSFTRSSSSIPHSSPSSRLNSSSLYRSYSSNTYTSHSVSTTIPIRPSSLSYSNTSLPFSSRPPKSSSTSKASSSLASSKTVERSTTSAATSAIATSAKTSATSSSTGHCGRYIGVEIIIIIDIIEVCPNGASTTITVTSEIETVTKSICASSTTAACYGCNLDKTDQSHRPAQTVAASASAMKLHGLARTSGVERTEIARPGSYDRFRSMFVSLFTFINPGEHHAEDVAVVTTGLPTHRATATRTVQHLTALPTNQAAKVAPVRRTDAATLRLAEREHLPNTPEADSLLSELSSTGALLGGSAVSLPLQKKSGALLAGEGHEPAVQQVKLNVPANMPLPPAKLPPSFRAMNEDKPDGDGERLDYILRRSSTSSSHSPLGHLRSTSKMVLCVVVLVCIAGMAVF